ncbi:MAG: DUF1289 domain-containing protein [Candidatus Saccharibacteria bacterium]|nr:DUF1289 domain-containing protein [Moraxellaceae bacterium]
MSTSLSGSLSPCAGKCSTVFGDQVCRGCRRFSTEVIEWNRYTDAQKIMIWQRLDEQLDRIVLPLVPYANRSQVDAFLSSRQVRLLNSSSQGRRIYEALRICKRAPELLLLSGLNVVADQLESIWQQVDTQLYTLAVANFEFTWLRAASFGM